MIVRALDFFAGSGLARVGLEPEFRTVWANDICPKKGAVYDANAPGPAIVIDSIANVRGANLPAAELAWASFPCQDLSLAGNLTGIGTGTRSGLFWEWIRVLDELAAEGRRPPLLAAENVVGFLIAGDGAHFARAYEALRERGYRAGALVIDGPGFRAAESSSCVLGRRGPKCTGHRLRGERPRIVPSRRSPLRSQRCR